MRTARQPASFIPPLIFPVALMTVNAAGLRSSTHLQGFPTTSFLAFALAIPIVEVAAAAVALGPAIVAARQPPGPTLRTE